MIDVTAEYLWSACYAVAYAGALAEANDPTAYNFAGFLHWLTGKGETYYLPWEYFDKDCSKASYMIGKIFIENKSLISLEAESLAVNSTVSVSNPQSVVADTFQSHNNWISEYTISVLSSLTISISRISAFECVASVSALLQCYDRADFNPGKTFMNGLLSDDSFLYLQQTGYAADFDEYSQRSFSKNFTFKSQLKE